MKIVKLFILLTLLSATFGVASAQSDKQNRAIQKKFVGMWKLISIDDRTPGNPNNEFNPTGYIIYDANGRMAVQITRRSDRTKFTSAKSMKATSDEKAAAFDSYSAYYGTYTIDAAAATVTHHLEGSLTPNDVGLIWVRYFRLSGDRISLIPVENNGKPQSKDQPIRSLTWERVK